jgi:6-phosphogluconolactonase
VTVEVLEDAETVAHRAAEVIAGEARASVAARGSFLLALSGGTTPQRMFQILAKEAVPWSLVHLFQVDERIVPLGHRDRNVTHLLELVARVALPASQLHPMPVDESDLGTAVNRYAATLREVAGNPAVLDLVHLGLGADGHTASLIPGDGALDTAEADVSLTGAYSGHRRMTLTLPVLNRARRILWLVTGADKATALARLRQGDRGIPAGRVRTDRALIITDIGAATT